MALPQDEYCTLDLTVGDIEQMRRFSASIAPLLEDGDVILLYGDLGAGKTTFVQCLAKDLGIGDDQYVSSPSFALMHEYFGRLPVRHMDLYRLTDIDDVEAAGLLEYFDGEGICLVEWPDRMETDLPASYLKMTIVVLTGGERKITLEGKGKRWTDRLPRFVVPGEAD